MLDVLLEVDGLAEVLDGAVERDLALTAKEEEGGDDNTLSMRALVCNAQTCCSSCFEEGFERIARGPDQHEGCGCLSSC